MIDEPASERTLLGQFRHIIALVILFFDSVWHRNRLIYESNAICWHSLKFQIWVRAWNKFRVIEVAMRRRYPFSYAIRNTARTSHRVWCLHIVIKLKVLSARP